MVRVVIHAGFHKTGTSSVQSMARANAALLQPHARILLRADFRALTEATRAYSVTRKPRALDRVHAEAEAVFQALDPADPRPVALLSEDLCGHLPGRHDIADYGAAPALMAQLAAAAVAVLGPEVGLHFHLSTRAAAPWFRSAYWQILRSARRTEGPEDFARLHAGAADFDPVVAGIAAAVAPYPVEPVALEGLREAPQGPMTPLLDLLAIPPEIRAALAPAAPANVRPEGLDEVFLALNRCGLPDGKVAMLKKTTLRVARRLQAKA
ncbi:MAG: hypothetical protein EP318_14955 [Rhodobacteraceae bacterium]|nr:MAG: hypothetical protein EP318_14955 [Paracoccaceae bacterium]